jgi:hypothetical protein
MQLYGLNESFENDKTKNKKERKQKKQKGKKHYHYINLRFNKMIK